MYMHPQRQAWESSVLSKGFVRVVQEILPGSSFTKHAELEQMAGSLRVSSFSQPEERLKETHNKHFQLQWDKRSCSHFCFLRVPGHLPIGKKLVVQLARRVPDV